MIDNGKRSFIQGHSLLSNVVAGYVDATRESNASILVSANISSNNSITYSKADYSNLYVTASTIPYATYTNPVYVGYWELVPAPSAFRIASIKKPLWLWRVMSKAFFGWTWHDGKL
jgi:hypothetical protein